MHKFFSENMKHIGWIIFLALLIPAGIYGQQVREGVKSNQETFYDASKQKLLGNYEKAEELFKKCLEIDPDDAASMYELAEIYRRLNKEGEAQIYAEKAVEQDPGNKWYKYLLLQVYQSAGDYSKAEIVIQGLIEDDPEYIDYYQDLALNQLYGGKYKDALKTYNLIEEKIGVTEHVSVQKEKIYLLMNKPEKAIAEIEKLTSAYPYETRYLEMLAELYMAGRMYDEALQTYKKILEVDPENPYINISLSDYYRKQGDEEKSYEYLKTGFANSNLDIDTKIQILLAYYTINEIYNVLKEEAFELTSILIEAHPGEAKAYSIYADLLYQDKQLEAAHDAFRTVISMDSSKYLVWEQYLFVISELGDFKAMADESARAIGLFPQQPMLYLLSGVANFQLKNYEKAADDLSKGVRFVVANNLMKAQFYSYLGDVYFQVDEHEKSDEAYDNVLMIDPDNSIVLNNYAYYLSLRDENLTKAEKMARRAVDLDPQNGANQDTYGWVLYMQGKYKEAEKWIGKAIRNREESAVVLEHYGDVLYKLGNKKGAVKYWEKAVKKGQGSEFLEKKVKDKILYE